MKKLFKVLGLTVVMSLSMSMISIAAQTDRWAEQNGTWYLKNEQGTGNTINSWFQDLDGSWYLLAPGDGHMYAGLIHDTLTDRWYFCQTEHDGWYGRMAHVDGLYTVNGQQVALTFTQEHNGYFGAIISGLESLKATGVVTQDVAGLPTESASASAGTNTSETNANNNQTAKDNQTSYRYENTYVDENGFVRDKDTNAVVSIFTDQVWEEFEANTGNWGGNRGIRVY